MTMLDRMRRHKSWLKWSLFVVVATFILLYVPALMSPSGVGAAPSDVVATVAGRKVTAATFQRIYAQQLQQIQASYGSINDDMLRQLQFGPRLLQQLVNKEATVAEAERLGLTVTDGELRERLVRIPAFRQNGQFVGAERYRQILDSGRPPIRPSEFELELRSQILAEKLQSALTSWVRVSDADVNEEYARRNEKVQLELAVFSANQFKAGIVPTEAEIDAEFKAHPDVYRTPEKRRVSYISVDASALRPTMIATAQEVDARYRQNAQTFSTPEQIRASHILLKTEGKDAAAVRKIAEGVLARAKAPNADFAALARQYSEDEQSKVMGGDLDYFSRGAMVPEFDDAAWKLQPGQISDLVQSPYGFHVIKLVDRRAASTRTIDEVRPQLEEQIKAEKAQAEATRLAGELAAEIKTPADLDRVAAARKLTVGDSGLFSRDEPIAGLGFAPNIAAQAFQLEKDKVSGQIATGQGYAFIALKEIAPPAMPELAAVRDRVSQSVVDQKAVTRAADKAREMAQGARANFAGAAKAAGVAVKTTELIARGSSLPEIGISPKVDEIAFKLGEGETSAPIETGDAVVVVRVKTKQPVDTAARDAARSALQTELAQQRQGAFFSAYMAKAMEKMEITYNNETLDKIIGN